MVPFKAYTQVYGDCGAPDILDGVACAFDQEAPFEAGDYVGIWSTWKVEGRLVIRPLLKRLVLGIDPSAKLPHIMRPGDELLPIVVFETTNPPRQFHVDLRSIYGMHKCIGVGRGPAAAGDVTKLSMMDPPPKPKRTSGPRLAVMGVVR